MMPISEIEIGDIFSNPMHRGFGEHSGLLWRVEEKKEGLVKVQPLSFRTMEPFQNAIWKKPSDRMFSESWRERSFRTLAGKN